MHALIMLPVMGVLRGVLLREECLFDLTGHGTGASSSSRVEA